MKILYTALLIILGTNSFSYAYTLGGHVRDAESGEPVPFADIIVEKGLTIISSDSGGAFSFKLPLKGEVWIEARRIGYRDFSGKFEFIEGRDTHLDINLYPLPLKMSTVVVESDRNIYDRLRDETSVVEGKALQRDLSQTLAASLRNETSVAVRSMGPAPARPVIRGMGGDRVLIAEDGLPTGDLSATSPDHAVSVEPFTVERIEVLRGPRLLLKSSSTAGGMVNAVREEIPTRLPSALDGNISMFAESANEGYLGSAVVQAPVRKLALRVEGSYRKSLDTETPGGRLENSDLRTSGYSAGLSYPGGVGYAGASVRVFDSEYGIPGGFVGAHPKGVRIDMLRRQVNARTSIHLNSGPFRSIEAAAGRAYYHHTEYESNGSVGAEFLTRDYNVFVNFSHSALGNLFDSGVIGVSGDYRDFEIGGYVFTPNSGSRKGSVYFFEAKDFADWEFQLGLRYEHSVHEPDSAEPEAEIGYIRKRAFDNLSFSVSGVREFTANLFAGFSVSRTTRTPTLEELYSSGPHLAAYSYEVGNPELENERGMVYELFGYYRTKGFFASITGFYNDFSYFITTRNTGNTNYQTLLPIYATGGSPVSLSGFEAEVKVSFGYDLEAEFGASYTRGRQEDIDTPLPMIPPFKGRAGLQYSRGNLTCGYLLELAAEQNRVDLFELPTGGYAVHNSYLQYSLTAGRRFDHLITLCLDNIFDTEYRNHLSRIKSILPEPGRNLRLIYRMYF